jgi:AcrR family transcriptional regulator
MDSTTPAAGRPRDRRIDEALLAATRELLSSQGYSGLSLAAVANRAGSSTPALYRRWPTKVHLVHAAAFPDVLASGPPPSGDLAADLTEIVRAAAELFSDPVVRVALPGLIGDLQQHPALHAELMAGLWGARLEELQVQLDDASTRGLVRVGVRAEHVLGLIGGSALITVLTPSGDDLDAAWVAAISQLVLEGVTT